MQIYKNCRFLSLSFFSIKQTATQRLVWCLKQFYTIFKTLQKWVGWLMNDCFLFRLHLKQAAEKMSNSFTDHARDVMQQWRQCVHFYDYGGRWIFLKDDMLVNCMNILHICKRNWIELNIFQETSSFHLSLLKWIFHQNKNFSTHPKKKNFH